MSTAPPNALARALRSFFAEYLPRVRGMSPAHGAQLPRCVRAPPALPRRASRAACGRARPPRSGSRRPPRLPRAPRDGPTQRTPTRNARLAAVHAFARYAAAGHPEHLELCQRLLAVPFKRARQRVVEYLEADELRALLGAPDRTTPAGRRDHALLLALFNTGARVQEILDSVPAISNSFAPLQVRLRGKGRKERLCPLWPQTAETLRALLAERGIDPATPAAVPQPPRRTPHALRHALSAAQVRPARARSAATTLTAKRVHPHVMRHTTAVHLLQAGVDLVTISHWLGHASVETTNRYAAVGPRD